MIKGIQKIKGLGVYMNYTQPAGTLDFGIKNLIYGWNYSGKTTLSRIFRLLDTKTPNPDLPAFNFNIDTDQGAITEANYQTCPHIVRVFNSDFVAENLNFAGTHFKPILLLGSESEAAQNAIDHCEKLAKRAVAGAAAAKKAAEDSKKALDKTKTDAAASIKSTMSLVSIFSSTQLDKELQTVGLGLEEHLLEPAALDADLKLARSSDQDQLAAVPEVVLTTSLDVLHAQAVILLGNTPSLASTIDHLVKHPLTENWVESGLPLHEGKTSCEFCGSDLDADHMARLKAHFSKDLANHKHEVQTLITKVESAKLTFTVRRDIELYAQFRARFASAQTETKLAVDSFNSMVQALTDDLNKKIQSPFVAFSAQPLDPKIPTAIATAVDALNLVIRDNNNVSGNFPAEKAAAITRLKLHFAKGFAINANLAYHELNQRNLARRQKKYNWCSEQLEKEIRRLKAIISQAQKGREDINSRIETLLGNESVQIAVVKVGDQDRFQLIRRDGKPGKHLSEGEKTAVAFAYFLTTLRDLKKPEEAIIYIDDPISSLDSNHIFQVNAMIKEAFFPKKGDVWKPQFKQVFFSTHNFEFYSLLRDLKLPKKAVESHYLIKRIAKSESTFSNMPKSMSKYSSEYHYLFDVLNEFHKAEDKTDYKILMQVPNAVRRFVELYTYAKYPSDKETSVDSRADIIFTPEKSKRILKVLHYFSHANNIERIAEHNDLICDVEGAVDDLMVLLDEKDPMHMQALRAAVA